jgi:hypothetical protein
MTTRPFKELVCVHCRGLISARNPKGFCDHLYYPDNCDVCKERLKPKKIWIEWIEPFGPNGESVYCRVTPETAIAQMKYAATFSNAGKAGFKYATDQEALDDFMIGHWAIKIEEESK